MVVGDAQPFIAALITIDPEAFPGWKQRNGKDASASVGDRVWTDTNANGSQDTGEPGINGVTVKLFDFGANLVGISAGKAGGDTAQSGATGFRACDADGDTILMLVRPAGLEFFRTWNQP